MMTRRKPKPRSAERNTAERIMRELADALSQDAGPIADVPFTLQAENSEEPQEAQTDLFRKEPDATD